MDMALNREFLAHEEGWDGVYYDFLISYLLTRLKLYEELRDIEIGRGGLRTAWWEEIAALHEAIVMHRHILLQQNRGKALDKLKDTGSSGRGSSFKAQQQQATINTHLIKLGRFYVDAAVAETTYLGKQRQYNELGFKILAMVYQRKSSGEALDTLIKANSIQRNQLWQMGKAHWRQASNAAASGDSTLAHGHYLQAKRRYLQALSRVETGKKHKFFNEFVALQKEITAWKQVATDAGGRAIRSAEVDSSTSSG
jgi:hypothetical protein